MDDWKSTAWQERALQKPVRYWIRDEYDKIIRILSYSPISLTGLSFMMILLNVQFYIIKKYKPVYYAESAQ